MPTSDYLADKILDHVYGKTTFTAGATLYCALFTVMPSTDGTGGTEVTGGSYARVSTTNNTTNFANAAARAKATGAIITFPAPTADWGNVVGAGWYDASSSGNLYSYGPLDVSKSITNGSGAPTIASGSLNFQWTD